MLPKYNPSVFSIQQQSESISVLSKKEVRIYFISLCFDWGSYILFKRDRQKRAARTRAKQTKVFVINISVISLSDSSIIMANFYCFILILLNHCILIKKIKPGSRQEESHLLALIQEVYHFTLFSNSFNLLIFYCC